jgi:hypothetical protein
VSGAEGGLLLLIMVAILAATMIVGTVKWLQRRREHEDRVTPERPSPLKTGGLPESPAIGVGPLRSTQGGGAFACQSPPQCLWVLHSR